MKYFLVGALANALLVIGVTLMFGLLGDSGFAPLKEALAGSRPSPLLLVGLGLVVVGLAFKLGAFPAQSWMPDVAEGAPVPAAAFLTVVPKIGAAVALMRLVDLFPADAVGVRPLIAVVSVATMTLGNLAALWQDDVRRLIGWSSVSQSGYALMAVCVVGLSGSALSALLLFLLGYTLANLSAFAAVAYLRGRTARADYAGLAASRPWAAAALVVSLLSLVGVPPLAGFVGKLALFIATLEAGYAWLAAVAVVNTVISLFYYLRVVAPVYFGRAPRRPAGQTGGQTGGQAEASEERSGATASPAVLGPGAGLALGLGAGLVVAAGLAAGALFHAFGGARLLP
jgi:NADH-quinone oxidoreductase subunit N